MPSRANAICALLALSALAVQVAILATTSAHADGLLSTESLARTVPYEGYLELDGVAVNGATDLTFTLRDSSDTVLWTEEYSSGSPAGQLTLYSGRFSVMLGAVVPISSTILDGEPLYIAVSVGDGVGGWTVLDGRQEVGMSPFSMWAAEATNLQVNGTLNVTGQATLTNLDLTDLELKGDLFDNSGNVTVNDTLDVSGGILNSTTNADLAVNDDLTVTGDITINNPSALVFGTGARTFIDFWNGSQTIGIQSWTQYFRSSRNFAWFVGGSHADGEVDNGGGTTAMTLSTTALTVPTSVDSRSGGVLELNRAVDKPVSLHYSTTGIGRSGDETAHMHILTTTSTVGGETCSSSKRGMIAVARIGAASIDSLCVCMDAGGSYTHQWNCLSR